LRVWLHYNYLISRTSRLILSGHGSASFSSFELHFRWSTHKSCGWCIPTNDKQKFFILFSSFSVLCLSRRNFGKDYAYVRMTYPVKTPANCDQNEFENRLFPRFGMHPRMRERQGKTDSNSRQVRRNVWIENEFNHFYFRLGLPISPGYCRQWRQRNVNTSIGLLQVYVKSDNLFTSIVSYTTNLAPASRFNADWITSWRHGVSYKTWRDAFLARIWCRVPGVRDCDDRSWDFRPRISRSVCVSNKTPSLGRGWSSLVPIPKISSSVFPTIPLSSS